MYTNLLINISSVCLSIQVYVHLYVYHIIQKGPGGSMSYVVGLPNNSYKSILRGFAPGFVNYKKRCTQLAAASDQVYQLLPHGRWFSTGTLASSTTKTSRHDIAEILLKVALNTINQIKSYNSNEISNMFICTLH